MPVLIPILLVSAIVAVMFGGGDSSAAPALPPGPSPSPGPSPGPSPSPSPSPGSGPYAAMQAWLTSLGYSTGDVCQSISQAVQNNTPPQAVWDAITDPQQGCLYWTGVDESIVQWIHESIVASGYGTYTLEDVALWDAAQLCDVAQQLLTGGVDASDAILTALQDFCGGTGWNHPAPPAPGPAPGPAPAPPPQAASPDEALIIDWLVSWGYTGSSADLCTEVNSAHQDAVHNGVATPQDVRDAVSRVCGFVWTFEPV